MNKRQKIFNIIEPGKNRNLASNVYDVFMIIVIFASLIPLTFKSEYTSLYILDKVCVGIFIVDYLLRWATADYKFNNSSIVSFIRYPISLMAIIDLLSILPSFTFFSSAFKALRLIRMFRALRVIRVFKVFRYSKSIQRLALVFTRSKNQLYTVGGLAILYIFISAIVVFNIEPESFKNFFEAIYWATVSLTTVGYGDIYPVSWVGRIITMISSFFGIAIVALPSGVITAEYMKIIEEEKTNEND